MAMNPSQEFFQNAAQSAAIQKQIQQERLRRQSSASDERNARERQDLAEAFLSELRKHKGDRVAALVAHVEPIVAAGAAALAKYDGHIEALIVAERNYRAADDAHNVAKARHKQGSLDVKEALALAQQVEITGAALRYRDRELTEAQRPSRVPNVGLPREAEIARAATLELVKSALAHPIDTSTSMFRPIVDVAVYARNAGVQTDASTAVWWIATECAVLADHEQGLFGRLFGSAEDAKKVENLKAVFEARWRSYERTQALPELARARAREGIPNA